MRNLALLLTLSLASTATAQACSTLAITGTGAPGTNLSISLSATPRSLAFLLIGDTAGTTTIDLGPISFELGLAAPFTLLDLGVTNNSGDLTRVFRVPPPVPPTDLLGQGLAVGFGLPPNFALSFCPSNVVPFHIG